ncbi:hypothetical protein WKR88_15095 [Trinickia caryophylli]|uniref:Uncharacterized protein n=1 Tax=Trinickia caryophylli TaxID=28094 RepID=A0A1X7D6T7_TRICW|nr:hypothetical protein [Trinickia caryophylli]TRX15075.1 hypothetical protein FNF07_28165 [Trinickia caryophylli]WQE14934.1 hypothetical protein U0034_20490 [Trinickia caryophylli]GLU31338.1 hypothetical protein Busp01_11800 [Trinickia caryophylli]SMF09933.1 hypothetical protein SAMN06295900_102465 [Trinickia caryophylli]
MAQRPAQSSVTRRRAWLAVPVIALLVACARAALMQPANEDARDAAALQRMSAASERMVVVVVASAGGPMRSPDGDTLDDRARRAASAAVAALENDYRLREVMEWPLVALQSHCVVLEIEGAQSRDEVLAKLSKDVRVRLAQPLLTFRPSSTRDDAGEGLRPHTPCSSCARPVGRALRISLRANQRPPTLWR